MTGHLIPRRAFDHLDSTNAEALRLAQAGERGPLWIDAAQQSLGRGRSGRHWVSESGNIMTSLLFTTTAPLKVLPHLSLLAGVAVIDAVAKCGEQNRHLLSLKWPNDVLLDGAKAGGILIESSTFSGDRVAVIGIGLNVSQAPAVDGVATANLTSVLGDNTGKLDELRISLATAVERWLKVWSNGAGFSTLRQAWLEHGPSIGTELTIKVGSAIHGGQFAGLDEQGGLRLSDPNGNIQCYTFGDVTLPRCGATS